MDVSQIPAYIAAVGALGVAAFGLVEALGKTLFVFDFPGKQHGLGLPYVGFGKLRPLIKDVAPALAVAYGSEYFTILRQQYRAGRAKGQAPETIRQGVRLGLPFLPQADGVALISKVWGLPAAEATTLFAALTAPAGAPAANAATLAARFTTALDSRVAAAFEIAEEIYETRAQFWAALIAIGLSLGYQAATGPHAGAGSWAVALLIGLVAVPLAPAAKDLSSSLSDALSALSKLRPGAK